MRIFNSKIIQLEQKDRVTVTFPAGDEQTRIEVDIQPEEGELLITVGGAEFWFNFIPTTTTLGAMSVPRQCELQSPAGFRDGGDLYYIKR